MSSEIIPIALVLDPDKEIFDKSDLELRLHLEDELGITLEYVSGRRCLNFEYLNTLIMETNPMIVIINDDGVMSEPPSEDSLLKFVITKTKGKYLRFPNLDTKVILYSGYGQKPRERFPDLGVGYAPDDIVYTTLNDLTTDPVGLDGIEYQITQSYDEIHLLREEVAEISQKEGYQYQLPSSNFSWPHLALGALNFYHKTQYVKVHHAIWVYQNTSVPLCSSGLRIINKSPEISYPPILLDSCQSCLTAAQFIEEPFPDVNKFLRNELQAVRWAYAHGLPVSKEIWDSARTRWIAITNNRIQALNFFPGYK